MSAKVCWVCVIERIQVLLECSEGDCWSHPSNRFSSAWSLMDLLNQCSSLSAAAQQSEKSGCGLRSQGWESYKGDKVIKTSSCPACWLVLSDPSLQTSHGGSATSIRTKLHQQLEFCYSIKFDFNVRYFIDYAWCPISLCNCNVFEFNNL